MLRQAPRWCPRERARVAWRKVRPEGARASRFECLSCGAPTRRVRGRPKRLTMPAPLYEQRRRVEEADGLWRRVIYAKAPDGRCQRCGRGGGLQAAHCVTRGRLVTRHDPDNGAALCGGCHMTVDAYPSQKRDLFTRLLGPERYEALRLRAVARGKADLDLAILELRAMLPRETFPDAPGCPTAGAAGGGRAGGRA